MPSWTPGPTVVPLCGLSGLPPRGTNRLHPSSATHTHSPPTCRPGHATLPSQVAHPWLLRCVLAANTKDARYKHNNVQTAASAALICVTYVKVHPLHHPPRCHRGSQRSQPQQSITLKLSLLSPKALAATSHPAPRCLDRWPQPSSYVSQEAGRMEREREIGHIRVWCWFSLRALKEENSLLIPSCLREVFVRDSPRSLRGHLSCR